MVQLWAIHESPKKAEIAICQILYSFGLPAQGLNSSKAAFMDEFQERLADEGHSELAPVHSTLSLD